MVRGRKPIPMERREKLGLPKKRNLTPPDGGIDRVPRAPRGLGEEGKVHWRRIWAAGAAWLNYGCDSALITRLCQGYDERLIYRAEIEARPMVAGSKGQEIVNPATVALRVLDRQLTSMESSLGFSPTDRARMGLMKLPQTESKLDELVKRRTASRTTEPAS